MFAMSYGVNLDVENLAFAALDRDQTTVSQNYLLNIAGSRYYGPASRPEGLQALTEALKQLPPNQPVVLYCGCCPWVDCPNMRPAYAAATSAGRTVRILYIEKNLQKDWIDQGLATANGEQ